MEQDPSILKLFHLNFEFNFKELKKKFLKLGNYKVNKLGITQWVRGAQFSIVGTKILDGEGQALVRDAPWWGRGSPIPPHIRHSCPHHSDTENI